MTRPQVRALFTLLIFSAILSAGCRGVSARYLRPAPRAGQASAATRLVVRHWDVTDLVGEYRERFKSNYPPFDDELPREPNGPAFGLRITADMLARVVRLSVPDGIWGHDRGHMFS